MSAAWHLFAETRDCSSLLFQNKMSPKHEGQIFTVFFMCRKIDSCCWLFWHVYTPSLFFSHLGLCNSWHFVRDGEICYIRYQLCACCSLAGKWGFGKRRRTWKWYRPFHHFFEWIWMCFNLALYWAISASRLEYRLNTLILGYPWFLFSISL